MEEINDYQVESTVFSCTEKEAFKAVQYWSNLKRKNLKLYSFKDMEMILVNEFYPIK